MNWSDYMAASGIEIGRGADLITDLRYISYVANREQGMTPEVLAKYFPLADKFEQRYQREYNAGARIADNCFCSCGARGYRTLCQTCQADENRAGR